ncbi:hypothetical protein JG687_00019302, partial [Phytophthora cactorum]
KRIATYLIKNAQRSPSIDEHIPSMSDVDGGHKEAGRDAAIIAERLSAAVFKALKGTRTAPISVDKSWTLRRISSGTRKTKTSFFTTGPDVAVAAAMVELQQILSEERDHQTNLAVLEPVAKAGKAPYVGDADAQFQAYLASCFSAYWAHMSDYTFPYVTIMQSSGFGKSRILQRLAETTAEGNSLVHDGAELDVTVLVVCMRNTKQSTGKAAR